MATLKRKKKCKSQKGNFLPNNGTNSIFYEVPYLLVYFICIMKAASLPPSFEEEIVLSFFSKLFCGQSTLRTVNGPRS